MDSEPAGTGHCKNKLDRGEVSGVTGMALNRRRIDIFFKYLFRVMSLTSILALASILIFVFVQGVVPFAAPSAPGIRIVTERIETITVNGQTYRQDGHYIDIPAGVKTIDLAFSAGGEEKFLEMSVDSREKDPEKQLAFTETTGGEISSPEAYTVTVNFPAPIAALSQKVHIILPEPPYSLWSFLSGRDWRPVYNKQYGIFPMLIGTLAVSFGAILLGLPLALLSGLFLAEFLPDKFAAFIRAGIELLAGIPSVVYGFFGLMVIVPAVKKIFQVPSGNGLLSAVLVLAVMILPTVIAITETSLRAVSQSHREASLSLGASKMQTAWFVTLLHAKSGVIAGVILGISRAVGETMALILVAGNSAQMPQGLTESIRTLTATIALEMGYAGGRHSQMLFSIGVVLFVLILMLNSVILMFRRRTEEEEE
ncbi:MAG: phosphate ABC transporter permease subunit PstC [Treponema sp.]|jgi:phosphate transport system permease protein|nr:phosphate ABC transporter permease subunit PstC [Treponema sp.]